MEFILDAEGFFLGSLVVYYCYLVVVTEGSSVAHCYFWIPWKDCWCLLVIFATNMNVEMELGYFRGDGQDAVARVVEPARMP